MIGDEDGALTQPGSRHGQAVHAIAVQEGLDERPAGGQEARPRRVDEVALGHLGGGGRGDDRHRFAQAVPGEPWIVRPAGGQLEQVRGRATDRQHLCRPVIDRLRQPARGGRPQARQIIRTRRVGGSDLGCQAVAAHAQARGPGRGPRADGTELGTTAADIDDQDFVGDRLSLRDPDEGQIGLLLVGQDLEGHPGRGFHRGADPCRIAGPPVRLRAEDGDGLRPVIRAVVTYARRVSTRDAVAAGPRCAP